MRLYYEFNKNFSDDAFLDELQGEMSKYKTLAHETIKWDRVFDCSYKILQSFSLDTKFFSLRNFAPGMLRTERMTLSPPSW